MFQNQTKNVLDGEKKQVIASYHCANSVIPLLMHRFILAQNFSIGFRSSE
ncbi:hypothetical protein HCUR_00709 [Holospora curviuscula]|uniref:Uncharacterized protein n=1 Tax=Holospora curviuscula TaxID=1082868 RepID=A0A2S5R9C6_9PROT|nr:hypothetical protein HCUR_00709 [Holospora curviuscula]